MQLDLQGYYASNLFSGIRAGYAITGFRAIDLPEGSFVSPRVIHHRVVEWRLRCETAVTQGNGHAAQGVGVYPLVLNDAQ
jgi:hypothetical protein